MAKKKEDIKPVQPIIYETDEPGDTYEGSEIEALKAQIKKLQKYIDNQKKENNPSSAPKSKKTVKFINLCNGILVLKGNQFWTIEGQFNSRSIPESEARAIVSNDPNIITSGMACVPDAEFLSEYDLDYSYEGVLDDKALKNLLLKDSDDIVNIYKNTSDKQRQIIVDMIVERKLKDLYVDANVLVEIGKLCGRDLAKIEPIED